MNNKNNKIGEIRSLVFYATLGSAVLLVASRDWQTAIVACLLGILYMTTVRP